MRNFGGNRGYVYHIAETDLDGTGSPTTSITIDETVEPMIHLTDDHQIDIDALTATVGTVTVEFLPYGSLTWKTLKNSTGADVALDLASPYPTSVRAYVSALRLTVNGANGTWGFSLVGK